MKGLFAFAAAVALLCACARGTAPQGHYQSTPVVADGQAGDWSQPLRFTNPRHTLSFNVTNDARNLYIVVMTRDDRMQRRILRAGMDVFFDPKGKMDKTIDLSYPESNSTDPLTFNQDSLYSKNALLAAASVYNTSGFHNVENGQYNPGDKHSPIQVALAFHGDSLLVYEAIVPLYTVLKRGGLDTKTLRRDFSVGIVIGNLPDQRSANRNQGNGGNGFRPHMGFGMGMGGMGMGMGMGGGGRGGQQRPQASQNESDWYTFKFAQPGAPS
ncbi:hypothetical protein [Dinghuibacter silviterrae]|uniref:Uncharacterized protein n=1 Tax=Dinghuibacter silviterrae TaxID=1539049 RepID=A0A4R8DSQ4_9BACT|nr:hypothetical protein [Dinghuibacter silviterrae]TDX01302.1 hypothetical protein EDB95_2335 [Dinghuibacter silviterrae]